ncbi:hypothetical protein LEMLEM_LOCUS22 [Lemmus lemmus]
MPSTHPRANKETWKEPWKEALVHLSGSYSSSSRRNSGGWGWDLASHSCLPPEAAHFLCGGGHSEKKTKVLIQCLWKSCGKALSTASGMEKHTHLETGRARAE